MRGGGGVVVGVVVGVGLGEARGGEVGLVVVSIIGMTVVTTVTVVIAVALRVAVVCEVGAGRLAVMCASMCRLLTDRQFAAPKRVSQTTMFQTTALG